MAMEPAFLSRLSIDKKSLIGLQVFAAAQITFSRRTVGHHSKLIRHNSVGLTNYTVFMASSLMVSPTLVRYHLETILEDSAQYCNFPVGINTRL